MAPSRNMEESDASMRARLVESLSQSFPGSALSRALHAMESDDGDSRDDPLSSSCFAEIRLTKGPVEEDDEELTSLSWLQDADLLKNIRAGDGSLCTSPVDDDMQKENGDGTITYGHQHPPHVPYNPQKHINSKPPYSFSCLIFMAIEDSPVKKLPVKDIYNWILTHFPYFQNAPTGWKNSVRHNLSLNKCFKKVEKEKGQSIGKGSLWCIDPDYRPNLLQALRKTPYHPYHQLQMLATPQPQPNYTLLTGSQRPLPLTTRFNANTPSPHLFPFLSRRLAQSKFDVESDIDVANTLVSLKGLSTRSHNRNGWSGDEGHDSSRSPSPPEFGSERERQLLKRKYSSRHRPTSPVVLTVWPSDDHAYSVTRLPTQPGSPGSSIDEEYDFDRPGSDSEDQWSDTSAESDYEDCMEQYRAEKWRRRREQMAMSGEVTTPVKQRIIAAENDDEEMKIVEGADALLNLAGIKLTSIVPLRSISPQQRSGNNTPTPPPSAPLAVLRLVPTGSSNATNNNNDISTSNLNQTDNAKDDAAVKEESMDMS